MMCPQDTKDSEGVFIVYDSDAKKILYIVEIDYVGVPEVTTADLECKEVLGGYGIGELENSGWQPIGVHDFIHYYFIDA